MDMLVCIQMHSHTSCSTLDGQDGKKTQLHQRSVVTTTNMMFVTYAVPSLWQCENGDARHPLHHDWLASKEPALADLSVSTAKV